MKFIWLDPELFEKANPELILIVATYPFLLSLKLVSNKVNSLKTLNKQPPEESEEEIIYWPMLQSLNLQDNNIKELGRLGSCPSLRDLDLSDNSIHTISEDFEGHEKLVTLDLKINNINSIARLSNLPELKILNLASNKIKEFVGLEGCPSIETLSLRSNNVKPKLKLLISLKLLYFSIFLFFLVFFSRNLFS